MAPSPPLITPCLGSIGCVWFAKYFDVVAESCRVACVVHAACEGDLGWSHHAVFVGHAEFSELIKNDSF